MSALRELATRFAGVATAVVVVVGVTSAPAAIAQVVPEPAQFFPLYGYRDQPYGLDDDTRPATRTASMAEDVDVTADGSLLVADSYGTVRSIGLDGIVHDVAGENYARTRPSDTPALKTDIGILGTVAALPDGGFLVSGGVPDGIWRVGPDQSIAKLARLDSVDLALLPDGDFLASDGIAVVRRITLAGNVTKFAGGWSASGGDGGPATRASFDPGPIAALPDGGALIAEYSRVRRVRPDGVISTFARMHPGGIAVAPDQTVYISAPRSIKQFSLDGVLLRVFSFAPDFTDAPVESPNAIAVLPDGNLAFTTFDRVWLLRTDAAHQPQRSAVALRNLSVDAAGATATVEATTAGSLTLSVRRKGRQPKTVRASVPSGTSTITLGGPFSSHGQVVRTTLRDAGGRLAEDRVRAWLGPRLPMSDARALMYPLSYNFPEDYRLGRCHRFGPYRVDCMVRLNPATNDSVKCVAISRVRIRRTGIPRHTWYGCRRGFRALPFPR